MKNPDEEVRTLYEKYYASPNILLMMSYVRPKDEPQGKVLLYSQTIREGMADYDDWVGFYCTKCGKFHEQLSQGYYHPLQNDIVPCECGLSVKNRTQDIRDSNISSAKRNTQQHMQEACPLKISVTEKGPKIRIAATAKNWYLDPRSQKPYTKKFTITIVINTETGQSYVMPAVSKGKPLFVSKDFIKNVTLTTGYEQQEFAFVDDIFVKCDEEVMAALKTILQERVPGISTDVSCLLDIVNANYLRALYSSYDWREGMPLSMKLERIKAWRMLRRRHHRDPETFTKYLYWGCSDVATKSIKRILYKHPDQKWTLYFLRRTLGIKNIDVLRKHLEQREGVATEMALRWQLGSAFRLDSETEALKEFFKAIAESGMPDKDKVNYVFSNDVRPYELKDSAVMLKESGLPVETIFEHTSLHELHDYLVEYEMIRRERRKWEKYNTPVEYDAKISAVEGPCGNAVFRLIRTPWDLNALGKKFHNCVGSYMEAVRSGRSIIIEMLLNEKPAACIELDGAGKYCRQAYAACNTPLKGNVAEEFSLWTKKHSIKAGEYRYHGMDVSDFAPF